MKHNNQTNAHLREEHMTGDRINSAAPKEELGDANASHHKNKRVNKKREEEEDDLMKRSDFKYYYTWRKLL